MLKEKIDGTERMSYNKALTFVSCGWTNETNNLSYSGEAVSDLDRGRRCLPFLFFQTKEIHPMTKQFVFRARVDASHRQKIENLLVATGCTMSELLRTLIERAEVEQHPTINVSLNANSDTTLAGNRVAVAL